MLRCNVQAAVTLLIVIIFALRIIVIVESGVWIQLHLALEIEGPFDRFGRCIVEINGSQIVRRA
ncbi:hypothetical protein B1810_08140 [Panacagrimonas perspica]|nr:hypothetical protein B1810_08140 [Panacagrimonas perspica]